ncbi:MAG: hypothetical protein AAGF73_05630 [Actinomycetota bacterium]
MILPGPRLLAADQQDHPQLHTPCNSPPPGAQPTLRNGHNLLIVFHPESSLQANTIVANDTDMRSILELTDLHHVGPVHVKT